MPTHKPRRHIKKLHDLAAEGWELWALDEVHFQQHGSRCGMWVPPEVKNPVVLHHPTRKSVGYYGAVRLRDGKFCFRRQQRSFDAPSTWAFLKQVHAASLRTGRRVAVILDNAKYHHAALHKAWRLEKEQRFRLLYLPPYSPELNPIERVWKLVRRLRLHNRYFSQLEDIITTVEDLFASWKHGSQALRKLCKI